MTAIVEELDDRLVRQAYDEALRQQALKVLNFGIPQNLLHNSDGTLTFHAVLTLAPEVQLPDYKGIAVKAPSTEVTDAGVARLKDFLNEVPADRFKSPLNVSDVARLFTVETFCKLVIRQQKAAPAEGEAK